MQSVRVAVLAALALSACDSTEPDGGGHGHTPESVQLVVGDEVIAAGGTLAGAAGATTRVEVQFLDGDGEVIEGIEGDHHTALTFTPTGIAAVAAVAGANFQKDVTFQGAAGTGTFTVGYGHQPAADELTFGPFNVVVEGSASQAVTIRFAGYVGDEPFQCGESYEGIGTTGSTVTPADFRLFVHDLRLVTAGGAEAAVTLEQDGQFQLENIALVDFEDGSGPCVNGTAETHTEIVGTVAPGSYTGVRFVLGVPFDRNHGDPSTAPAPLSLTSLNWGWNIGYLFTRIDLETTGVPGGWFVHLGSTGCTPDDSFTTPPTTCASPNRPEIELTGFDPGTSTIVADVATLLSASNVDENQGGPGGCMSGPTDPECPPVMSRLGLEFNGTPSGGQALFRVGGQ